MGRNWNSMRSACKCWWLTYGLLGCGGNSSTCASALSCYAIKRGGLVSIIAVRYTHFFEAESSSSCSWSRRPGRKCWLAAPEKPLCVKWIVTKPTYINDYAKKTEMQAHFLNDQGLADILFCANLRGGIWQKGNRPENLQNEQGAFIRMYNLT